MSWRTTIFFGCLTLLNFSISYGMANPNKSPRGSCQCRAAVTQEQKGRLIKMGDRVKIPNLTENQCKMLNGTATFGFAQGAHEIIEDPVYVRDCNWSVYIQ